MSVTSPMIRTLAERKENAHGISGFKALEGWLAKVESITNQR